MTQPKPFRDLCAEHGIAVTHQRQVLYEVMQGMEGHPSPEEVYARVREQIPSISLATVYKNIHLFVESGVLREVSLHHGSIRVEMNDEDHHHMVCSKCKAIADIGEDELGLETKRRMLPGGFLVERFSVDVIGICANCQREAAPSSSTRN
ncbi:Fur family transcriptional regulator [Granulicella arctica]|uniref:Fur family peroxide stress response transcriptional regulator n=1 Tax=Granulicella arctica TaxID=940613 RepID=A0A7Y9PGK8_9BACT|nr:transcriptional repressor [Granulicella arctica]NYF79520.1 Fur family peroxide stress response transcriptional regulator [Granulicella arctica]